MRCFVGDIKRMYEDVRFVERNGRWPESKVPDWIVEMKREYGSDFNIFQCVGIAWYRIACALATEKGW